MIPEGWEELSVGDLVAEVSSRTIPAQGDMRRYVGLEHIQPDNPNILSTGSGGDVSSQKTVFESGDILFGKLRPYLRKVALARFQGICSTDILVLRPRNRLSERFCLYFLSSEVVIAHAVKSSAGTKMPRTSWKELSTLRFFLPPLKEQRAIAEILDSVEATIAATEATLAQTRRVKQALLQQLLTKGIDENGRPHTKFKMTEIGEIPEAWEVRTVGEACSIENGGRKPISRAEREGIKGEYPYYGPTGILDYISEFKYDGTFATIGEDGDHFLKWASRDMSILVSGRFNVNNHAHVIGASPICRAEWFFQFFRQRDITKHLTRQGVARYKLTKAALGQLYIAIPPIAEQLRVHELMERNRLLEQTQMLGLERTIILKRALLRDLLTGKVRVKDVKL